MAIQPKWWKVFRSNISGQKPTVNNLDLDAIGINRVDGVLFIKKRSLGGVEEIVEIVGGPTGTGNLHNRAHQIDSIDDHPPVPEGKRGKIVATDPVTGAIVLIDPVGGGDSYEYWKLKGGKVPKYGLLYNWYAATDERNITSSDTWVVPTSTQRNTLFTYIGGTSTVGGKLKELGLVYWLVNVGATNEYGFNARGAGERTASSFDGLGAHTRIMCSNQLNTTNMQGWQLVGNSNNWTNAGSYKYIGWSIRLMRPATAEEQLLADGTACENYIGNDGKIYRTVKIGTQVWTAANSAETQYRNGNTIPEVTDNSEWAALTTGALCAYDNDWSNVFMQNDVNINSHDRVTFKDSATVEFSVTENEDGEKEITAEAIGGNDHPRAHQIDSIEDHPAVPAEKRNRWVHTNAETGEIELIEQGPQGDPGLTPFIGANGNWWIGTTDTGVKAQGEDGNDGINPHIGANGNWWVGTFDTGIKAAGTDGEDGLTPYIGTNGNWWIGATDTGVKAQGEDGNPADLTHNTYLAWRDAPGTGFTLIDNLICAYQAILVTHEVLDPPVEADFDGLWTARMTPEGPTAPQDLILPRTLQLKNSRGIKTKFQANEAQVFGDVCFINSAGKTQIGNATTIATATVMAMCIDNYIAANAEGNYLLIGFANNNEWAWAIGGEVYLSLDGTSGNTLTQTSPFDLDPIVEDRVVQLLGIAKTATSIYFNPQLVQVELKPE